jgi:hypothetical protein
MNASKLQKKLHTMLEQITNEVNNNLIYGGDTCEESQKACLIQAINDLHANICGISDADMIKK